MLLDTTLRSKPSSQLPVLLTIFQAAILTVLMSLSPFLMRLQPPAGLGHDVWAPYQDPQAVLRSIFIVLGALSPLLCLGATILTWRHNERPGHVLLIQIAFTLAVFAIGWRARTPTGRTASTRLIWRLAVFSRCMTRRRWLRSPGSGWARSCSC